MSTPADDLRRPFFGLLHRPLDLGAYFEAADRALRRRVAFDASCWLSLDPGTVLPTSHFSRAFGFEHLMELVANEFLEDDVNKFAALARAAQPVGILSQATGGDGRRSPRYVKFLAPHGFENGDELRAVFRDGDEVWGAVALHRQRGTFVAQEAELIADIGGVVAHGIRRAILRTALGAEREAEAPGLILLGPDDSVATISGGAEHWLGELFDSPASPGGAPLTVVSVAQQARLAGAGRTDQPATVRLPRRSGGWLRMDASLVDNRKPGRVAVILSAAREPEVASLLAQVYGLSVREREVTRLVLRGHSTLEMAVALHVTRYTVQDHLKSIFAKIGVRSRRELVAQLFLQQCAPRLTAGAVPGANGWFLEEQPATPAQDAVRV